MFRRFYYSGMIEYLCMTFQVNMNAHDRLNMTKIEQHSLEYLQKQQIKMVGFAFLYQVADKHS